MSEPSNKSSSTNGSDFNDVEMTDDSEDVETEDAPTVMDDDDVYDDYGDKMEDIEQFDIEYPDQLGDGITIADVINEQARQALRSFRFDAANDEANDLGFDEEEYKSNLHKDKGPDFVPDSNPTSDDDATISTAPSTVSTAPTADPTTPSTTSSNQSTVSSTQTTVPSSTLPDEIPVSAPVQTSDGQSQSASYPVTAKSSTPSHATSTTSTTSSKPAKSKKSVTKSKKSVSKSKKSAKSSKTGKGAKSAADKSAKSTAKVTKSEQVVANSPKSSELDNAGKVVAKSGDYAQGSSNSTASGKDIANASDSSQSLSQNKEPSVNPGNTKKKLSSANPSSPSSAVSKNPSEVGSGEGASSPQSSGSVQFFAPAVVKQSNSSSDQTGIPVDAPESRPSDGKPSTTEVKKLPHLSSDRPAAVQSEEHLSVENLNNESTTTDTKMFPPVKPTRIFNAKDDNGNSSLVDANAESVR
ncbi:unnamed protein product [Ambrosiozyma monospora]|uniref:Unnamed protein product n=1 Tax=Ambrosiozyma monospora TaxID=43982 RepID=A0ACB5SRZ2_AMBMO|nr:unnamed protein product [Ambrosiozyma monospora]